MNMRKIIAVVSAVLMLCAIVPMGVFAAPGDVIIEKNFDDGSYFSNGSNENGYMVFDATTANWANVYLYANAIKSGTKYEISFDCKADKAANINVKINNNWAGDTFKWTTNVTTEWVTYTCVINPDELATLTSTALLMFTSNTYAADGAVYHIDNVVVKEYTDPDTIGKITNGSFEDGTNGWSVNSAASLVTDAQDGSQALQMSNPSAWASVATQTIPVEANASYEITWYSKRLSGTGAFNLIACQSVSPWGNYTKVAGQNWMNETSGEWVANTYTVNVGDNTSMLLKFTTEAANPGEILIDNVVVSKLKDPSFDGYITNGDFETGKVTPWTVYSGTAVSADAAKDGDYGLYINNPAGDQNWGGTAYQNFTTEVGKTYVVMMDAKAINQGQNIQIKDNGTVKASKWFSATSWTTLTFEYTAETTTGTINICGGGTGSQENIYVDNVFVFEKKAASNDGYIVNGDFETGTTEGLSPSSQTTVSRDAAKDGNFGLYLKNQAGNWGGVGLWTINGLEVGATYKLEMDMKAVSKGVNWTLWQDSTSSNVKYANGYFATAAWTTISKEFVANTDTAVLNINGGNTGVSEEVYLDNLKITKIKDAHVCEFVGEVTLAPTCTEPGVMTYSCTCGEGTYTEEIPAAHTYDDDCDSDCNVCEEWRDAPHNLTTHVEAVEPANCQEEGYNEHWICEDCGGYFMDNGAGGYYETNPAWMYYYGDCVRPEGAADCAVVPCEVCGNDTYGDGEHDTGVPACQSGTCSKCGDTIEGYGHQNYDGPACLPGNCYYCGEAMEPVAHENGAWAPCQIGECSYGCGLTYPATAEHVDEDADDYCDTCWNHLNHDVDPCVGGECSICWTYVEGAHTYDNAFDADCNACGEIREVASPISYIAKSVSEDVNGYAVLFDAAVEGIVVKAGTFVQADYTNATCNGYKLLGLGVKASNGISETTIEGLRMYDLEESNAKFAFRIINIPADKLNVEITMTPYYTVEIDGVETTLYGEAVVGSYAEVAG